MATFCSNCDEMLCSCSHPNQVPRYELEERMTCEWAACKKYATQADTYINAWLCDKHYSKIGTSTEDYQADNIDWDYIDNLVIPKILKKGVTP